MAISKRLIRQAARSIAQTDGLLMDPTSLAEDVIILAHAFPAEDDFMAACASTCRAISNISAGKVSSSELKNDFEGWKSYHYQHRVGQRARADCRIIFRETGGCTEVMGFGHRYIPFD